MDPSNLPIFGWWLAFFIDVGGVECGGEADALARAIRKGKAGLPTLDPGDLEDVDEAALWEMQGELSDLIATQEESDVPFPYNLRVIRAVERELYTYLSSKEDQDDLD